MERAVRDRNIRSLGGGFALLSVLCLAALLAMPAPVWALHYVDEGSSCYSCHTLDTAEGEPNTSYINGASRTLPDPTDIGADLYGTVAELYSALPGQRRRIRLLGVQATGLVPAGAEQLALLDGERWGDMERAIDRIERRFGRGAARPASLIERDRQR